jgi:hypothetical protein
MAKLNTDTRKKLLTKDFAEPKERAYPVEDRLALATPRLEQVKPLMPGGCRRRKSAK